MTTRIAIAIMSHLSDAQIFMKAGMVQEASTCINFAKMCVNKFDNMNEEVEYDILDEIWETAKTFR